MHQTLCLLIAIVACTHVVGYRPDIPGSFCRNRRPSCCPGRDDSCSVPIRGTLCYCDTFCNRTSEDDCCPDFRDTCGHNPQYCVYRGRHYHVGHTIAENCNTCTCRQTSYNRNEFVCENKVCLVRQDLIDEINRGNFGWRASNYSFLWGKTLDEVIRSRLGTVRPVWPPLNVSHHIGPNNFAILPETFDAREKWPGIRDIRDQGNCGASWAFSTTSLASDRMTVQSYGAENVELSPQHLISCLNNGHNRGCDSEHLSRAWRFMNEHGVTTADCYPYLSGSTGHDNRCNAVRAHRRNSEVHCPTGGLGKLYKATSLYRISTQEESIMNEIYSNGPVQASLRVRNDFFLYRSGVYSHSRLTDHTLSDYTQYGWHSVRIIGWGVERTPFTRTQKYWLCANSWGKYWGEDGYFRIARGSDESEIENYVLSVWIRHDDLDDRVLLSAPRRGFIDSVVVDTSRI